MEVSGRRNSLANIMLCKPCEDDSKRVPANGLCRECEEHMCVACFGNHKKYKICKDHKLVDIDTDIPDSSYTKEDNFENCPEHTNENVKFYCSAHETVGCGDCMIINHKTCKVEFVRNISKAFKDSKEFKDILKDVESCQKAVQKCSTTIKNNKLQAEDVHQGFLADIKSFRDELSSRLDKLEEKIVEKAKDAKTTDKLYIESLEAPCENLETELTKLSDDIVSKTDDPNKLFVAAMKYKLVLKWIEQELCRINLNNRINIYSFKRNNAIKELLEQVELGTIHSTQEEKVSGPDLPIYDKPISVQAKPKTGQIVYGGNTYEQGKPDTSQKVPSSVQGKLVIVPAFVQGTPETSHIVTTSVQAKPGTSQTIYGENTPRLDSQSYETPVSKHAKQGTSQMSEQETSQNIYEDTTSVSDPQAYEDLIYEEIPESNISRRRGSSKHKNWSLFENQLRCENLLMAGEYLSFKDNGKGDIGLFIGKKAIKAGTYFEVEVISSDDNGNIAIGFVPKDFSLKEQPGIGRFSIGYHTKDGCKHDESTSGERISPPCRVGDVIGIGVASLLTNVFRTKIDIFFTRNHRKIGALEINNPSFCKVYPAVAMQSTRDKARVILDAKVP